jgi:hypothetical protein
MKKEVEDTYMSPVTDNVSGHSVVHKLKDSGACTREGSRMKSGMESRSLGGGFVFNKSVKLTSPSSFFGGGLGDCHAPFQKPSVLRSTGDLKSGGSHGASVLNNFYKSRNLQDNEERRVQKKEEAPECHPPKGYVKSLVDSGVFSGLSFGANPKMGAFRDEATPKGSPMERNGAASGAVSVDMSRVGLPSNSPFKLSGQPRLRVPAVFTAQPRPLTETGRLSVLNDQHGASSLRIGNVPSVSSQPASNPRNAEASSTSSLRPGNTGASPSGLPSSSGSRARPTTSSVLSNSSLGHARAQSYRPTQSLFSSPLSTRTAASRSATQSPCIPIMAPIDVMYGRDTRAAPRNQEYGLKEATMRRDPPTLSTPMPVIFSPGPVLTRYPTIMIMNTVLDYLDGRDNTNYYILIESNVSWTVCKTLKQLLSYMPEGFLDPYAYASPYQRKIRDSMIQATLNSRIDRSIQSFILSDICTETRYRSSYLLMQESKWKPYLFKLVGKALICYENNKVHKIFLLSGCAVEPVSPEGFKVGKGPSSVELYATCEKERDQWIRDLREHIIKVSK